MCVRMCMCVHEGVCMYVHDLHVCMHVCIHGLYAYMYLCACKCMCMYMHTCMHTCVYVYACACVYVSVSGTNVCTCKTITSGGISQAPLTLFYEPGFSLALNFPRRLG